MTAALTPPAWMDDAACTQIDTETFYPEDGDQYLTHAAKRFCKTRCPVIDQCLRYAIDNNEHGIWGGTGPTERRRIGVA